MRIFVFLVGLLAAGTIPATGARAELLTNPGFENTDNDDPATFGDGWGSFGNAGFNSFFGANGHASFFLDNAGNSGGVFQSGIAGSFGNQYTFSLDDVLIEDNAAATSFDFGLEFYQADDATIISSSLVSLSPLVNGSGVSFSHTAAAPVGTVFVRPIISFSGATGAATEPNVFVFDSSLTATAVPEPSSMVLFAATSIAGLIAHRRRKSTTNRSCVDGSIDVTS